MSPWLSDLLLRSQSDERLVSLARTGHERAFVVIVERYKRQLVEFARHLGMGGHSEDVVQQAFLSALAALRTGAEVRHLSGWLHQIVRHAAIRASVHVSSDAALDQDVVDAADLEALVELRMLARMTLTEVAQLPPNQRDALLLTAVHGRSRTEVATTMGLSEGAVRQLVHRARTHLRTAVSALTPLPLAAWAAGGRVSSPGELTGRVSELVIGAGSASTAGVALKASAVVIATGALATGLITARPHTTRPPRHADHARVAAATGPSASARSSTSPREQASAPVLVTASTASPGGQARPVPSVTVARPKAVKPTRPSRGTRRDDGRGVRSSQRTSGSDGHDGASSQSGSDGAQTSDDSHDSSAGSTSSAGSGSSDGSSNSGDTTTSTSQTAPTPAPTVSTPPTTTSAAPTGGDQ